MRHAKHLARRAQTITEPDVVGSWEALPTRPVLFARNYMRAFANVGCIGIQVHVDEQQRATHHIWLWTKEHGLSRYTLLRTIDPEGKDT